MQTQNEKSKEEIQKDKQMKCCDKCWNNKFALGRKQKEKFSVCGIPCECHKKQWDERENIQPVADTFKVEEGWIAEFDSKFDDYDRWGNTKEIKDFIKDLRERDREATTQKILNALRYVVAEDEDGYDTLEEIIKISGIDKLNNK